MNRKALALTLVSVLVFSAIAVVIALRVITIPTSTPSPTKPEYVTVSGTANNTDHFDYASATITPNLITFTSQKNGTAYEARFNGQNYSISLPNSDSYNVTINWQFTTDYAADAYADSFKLDATEASVTRNWVSPYQYPPKPGYVIVSGTATHFQGMPSYVDPKVLAPIKITFTSVRGDNGKTFETRFFEGGAIPLLGGGYNVTGKYSIPLPNDNTYSVIITWQMNIIYHWDADATGSFNLNTTETSITQNWDV